MTAGGDLKTNLGKLAHAVKGYVLPVPTLITIALTDLQRVAAQSSQRALVATLRKIAGALERPDEDAVVARDQQKGDDKDKDDKPSVRQNKRAKVT